MANILKTSIVLRNDTAEKWAAVKDTVILKAGEMGIETDTGLFKIGDGNKTWGELSYANDIPDIDLSSVSNSVTVADTLEGLSDGKVVGDIGIVKAPLFEGADEYTYTAYVWSAVDKGFAWAAMDGNYSADNVFTSKKITLAGNYSSIGNYAKGKELAAGTSLQTILSGMLQTTLQPTKTAPSATISATGDDGGKETGDSYTKPTGTITVTSGSYTYAGNDTGVKYAAGKVAIAYGPDPEVDKATYRVTNSGELGNGGTVSIPATTYAADATTALYTDDSVSYTFSGMAHNEQGNVAKDNLGDDSSPVVQIAAGDLNVADKTVSFRGYRKMFIGCTSAELTSDVIRALSLKNAKAATGAIEVTAPVGATQLVVAVPTKSVGKKYTMTKAEMYTSNWEDYTSLFSSAQTVQVADKRGGENGLQNYNVYTYSFAALKAATRFRITLANANA